LATYWNLLIKIWQPGNFFFSKSDEFGPFFPWKFLCIGWNLVKFYQRGKKKKKTIGTSFGPDHTLKRFEAILARLVLQFIFFWRGNVHVCHFVRFGRIEQEFIEFRNDLRLWNGLDPWVRIHDHALKPSQTIAPPSFRFWYLLLLKEILSVNKAMCMVVVL
jgi:hypothetical protein